MARKVSAMLGNSFEREEQNKIVQVMSCPSQKLGNSFALCSHVVAQATGSGSMGRDELAQRIADFDGGRWIQLLDAASAFTPTREGRAETQRENCPISHPTWPGLPRLRRRARHFNLLFPQEQAQIVLVMPSAATELNPVLAVLSIDGVGAYDHTFRSAMLSKVAEVPSLQGLLPFVKKAYARPTSYVWTDEGGVQHTIEQHEGGEQGDLLMPLQFSLGIHDALSEVQQHLQPGERFFAYLDDVYVLSSPERIREVCNMLETTLRAHAGIQLHTGTTRTWNVARERPENMEDVGPDVWNPQRKESLSDPIGNEEFVSSFIERRLADNQKLWDATPNVPNLQCAWQVLLQCAGPRCHHLQRTVPPSLSEVHAQGHDVRMQSTMEFLLGTIPAIIPRSRWLATSRASPSGIGRQICSKVGTNRIFGLLGGCLPNVATTPSQLDTPSRGMSFR